MPLVGVQLVSVRSALKNLFDAINELTAKVRNTRVEITRNDEGKITGVQLKGGAAEDLARLQTSLAHGGIVKKPITATVGDGHQVVSRGDREGHR